MRTSLFLILITSIIAVGCSDKTTLTDEEQIVEVLKKSIEGLSNEDMDMVKETTSTQSPMYESTISLAENLFDLYDLKYELESYVINEIKDDEAYVTFVQVTKKVSGPEFKDNRLTGIHTLKKEDGEWKLYSTRINNVDYNL